MMIETAPRLTAELVSAPALEELAALDQWVVSKLVNGQKPPFSPYTRRQCSHSNPEHWSSYQTALTALPGFDWLGFVFHDADPYSGIDLDGCRDKKTGAIEGWAQRWIDVLDSYTEISPSQEGVKIFVRGTLPAQLTYSLGKHKGIEVYSTHRYFTVTGQHLAGTPTEIRDAQPALDLMWTAYHKEPEPAAPRKEYIVSKGEATNDRQNARDVIAGLNRSNDAGDYLEHQGATLIRTRGEVRYYTGLAGEAHANGQTYIVSPAKDGNGHICFSYSPNGKLSKADFPRGFRWFDAVCTLEHSGDVTAALQALNPIPAAPAPELLDTRDDAERWASQQAIEYGTDYVLAPAELERRATEAQRKRAARHEQAAETRADVRRNLSQDTELTDAERAIVEALLTIAGDRCWCRPSKARIAEISGVPLGTVKRAMFSPAKGGRLEGRYFVSTGKGGGMQLTAIRTFLRGSIAPELIHESYSIGDLIPESLASEGGAILQPAPAQSDPVELLERLSFASYLRNLGELLGEELDLAALAALSQSEQEACEAQLLERLAQPAAPATCPDSDMPALASYTPVEWSPGPYTGIARQLMSYELRAALALETMRPLLQAELSAQPEQLQLEQPALRRRSKPQPGRARSQPGALDRYLVELARMSESALAGELKKHQRTLAKHSNARWLGDIRDKLGLVEQEIDARSSLPTPAPRPPSQAIRAAPAASAGVQACYL